jgi:hypothetical protein
MSTIPFGQGRRILAPDEAEGFPMGTVVYHSRVTVRRDRGPDRTASLPAGERAAFGVHGAIAEHYGVDASEHPPTSTTLDYIVAAAAG